MRPDQEGFPLFGPPEPKLKINQFYPSPVTLQYLKRVLDDFIGKPDPYPFDKLNRFPVSGAARISRPETA